MTHQRRKLTVTKEIDRNQPKPIEPETNRPDGSFTSIFGTQEDEEALDKLDLRRYRRADLPSYGISEAGLATYNETVARIFDGIAVKLDQDSGESVVQGTDVEIARAIKLLTLLHIVCFTAINSRRNVQKTIRKRLKMFNKGWWRYLLEITSLAAQKIRKAGKNSADVMIPKKKIIGFAFWKRQAT